MKTETKTTTYHTRKPNWIILSLPLIISLMAIHFISNSQISLSSEEGVLFSPPSDKVAIIIGLVIFSVSYVLFLLILFHENLKEYFYRLMLRKHLKH